MTQAREKGSWQGGGGDEARAAQLLDRFSGARQMSNSLVSKDTLCCFYYQKCKHLSYFSGSPLPPLVHLLTIDM